MARRVNYADNIFYLNLILKQAGSSLKLNVDAELLKDKLIEDLLFLDRSCGSIFSSLQANHMLIDRLDHLKDLAKFNRQYIGLLEDIAKGSLAGASVLEDQREVLERIRQGRSRELAEIREAIASHRLSAGDKEQIVSEEEFKFLLSSGEDSEGS